MPAPERGGRSAWPIARLVLAALLILLVAAGVYARAHTSFPFRTPPRLSPTAVSTTFLVVEAIGLVFVVLLAVTRRRHRKRDDEEEPSPINRWIVAAVNLTVFLLVLLLASWLIRRFRADAQRRRGLPSPAPPAGSTHQPSGTLPPGAATLWLIWLGVVVLAIAVVVAVALWRRGRGVPPSPVPEDEPVPDAGDAALRAGRRALDASDDPRAAVIACYEAMERDLAEAGVERPPAQTPEELLARARGRDVVASEHAARTLVDLFGRARFSSRPIDASDVATARTALAELLAETRDRAQS